MNVMSPSLVIARHNEVHCRALVASYYLSRENMSLTIRLVRVNFSEGAFLSSH